jgi:hypothetical protein
MVATDNLYCVLKFTKNHVKRDDSRKAACPFFVGKACCKFAGCTRYTFTIKKKPKKGKSVKVKVEVIGDVKHEKGVFHRHRVTGKQRIGMANLSKEKGPTETFYDNLANSSIFVSCFLIRCQYQCWPTSVPCTF